MTSNRQFLTVLICFMLLGCGQPVPVEKSAYIGEWKAKTMVLVIKQDGSIRYKRVKGSSTTTVKAPLKRFVGNNFEVGIGPFATQFVVSKPPFKEGGRWKMVVDGLKLTKTEH